MRHKTSTFLTAVCGSYTLISLFIVVSEAVNNGISSTHFNLLMGFVYTLLAVGVLFTHHLLDNLSPLVMVLLQYTVAIVLVVLITYVTGCFVTLHPDAYKDSIRSFSLFYLLGALYYYISIRIEVKKQNESLFEIRSLNK